MAGRGIIVNAIQNLEKLLAIEDGIYLLAVLLVLIFAFNILLLREVRSMGDASNQPLDLSRVRGGMLIGLLAVLQGLVNIADVLLVVATIGGLCIGMAFRRAFQNPVIG